MRSHDVGQSLLQDVTGALLTEKTAHEHLAHGFHASETGALSGGHIAGVDGREELGRGESCRQEGVDRRDEIPRGDRIHAFGHRRRDAPPLRVEVERELATDRA